MLLRAPDPDPRRGGRTIAAAVLLLAAALGVGVLVWRRAPAPAPAPERYRDLPNIVLVTVDTLRVDHLSCYGHFRETSPRLDAVAAEGVLVERAMATSGTTLPSHLSILTGLYPHQHGYLANHGAIGAPFRSVEGRRSVTQPLRAAGYQTVAFVSGPTVSHHTGIDDGFEHFDDHDPTAARDFDGRARRSDETTDRALEWLASEAPREPFFLWVHYWDPHEPNRPPEPHATLFAGDERVEELLERRRVDPAVLAERFSRLELSRLFAPELTPLLRSGEVAPDLPPIDRAALVHLIDSYDGDVRFVDDQVGRLVDALRARGLWERSIFALTADHGQSLGQHDWLEHGQVQQDNVHVPLVLRFPGGAVRQPARVPGPVSLVDLLPTIVARLESPAARAFLAEAEGQDFLSPGFDRPFAFAQRSVRERDWEPGLVFALRTKEWTYYHYTDPDHADRLFRIEEDPLEQSDVAAQHPEVVEDFRQLVVEVLNRRPYRGDDSTGEESEAARRYRQALENLGYVGDEAQAPRSGGR